MSWGLGWKRLTEVFNLTLQYGSPEIPPAPASSKEANNPTRTRRLFGDDHTNQDGSKTIELGWTAGDDEDQIALRLQSQLMMRMPSPRDTVLVELSECVENEENNGDASVAVRMKVVTRREPLRAVKMAKVVGSGQTSDGIGVLTKLLRSSFSPTARAADVVAAAVNSDGDGLTSFSDHWKSVTELHLSGCGISVLPAEVMELPLLEKLYLDNNKLSLLPPELGALKNLKVLSVDNNMLVSVPVELRQCVGLVELSLEHNKLIRPLLDFRAMSELRVLRLFGNPLEFLPEILPLRKLRHLSLANIRVVGDENLRSVSVQIEAEVSSYFGSSKQHKLSAFFSLIFRFSSCHHPLLASALAKIMEDQQNRAVVSKDENAVRQLISMISTDNRHVVEEACFALSSLAADVSGVLQLMRCDIMKPVETVLKMALSEELISVLHVVSNLAFASDSVAQKMMTKDLMRSLKILCSHKNPEVQRLALLAIGNLAFCLENRQILITSESLRELLMRLISKPEPCVNKAAARALAILGENEIMRRAVRGRSVARQGLRILCMDGGGMKGLATVNILKEIEKGTGKPIHEMFDLICGTSTGGMLAVALGIKAMTLDKCEEIYKKLGKLVFAEPPKENEVATWREKLDYLYKSSSQNFRVAVHGAKHSADQFERLLKEMCADEVGDLLIDSAVKGVPKVFVISTLVSVVPAQPFVFRNYQYPAGTPEMYLSYSENSAISMTGAPNGHGQVGYKRNAFIGSCKHQVWQAIRASSAAPYYLDDYSDGINRWQDGAIVANNPTIFAIREAQLLWPDTKIDCLVSIGCGSVPTKVRKTGWLIWDTVPVLVESACSIERVEEALSALIPMLPEIQYFRFNPVDDRCDMDLDETDPSGWLRLETATKEYIRNNSQAFKSVCERLMLLYQQDEKWLDTSSTHSASDSVVSNNDDGCPSLGWRRNVVLVEAAHSIDSGRVVHHARSLETFCKHNGIRVSCVNAASGSSKMVPTTVPTSPFASPMFTGSFPSSPLLYSPDIGASKIGRIDLVPPLSLDGHQPGKSIPSPPPSPGPRALSAPAQVLFEKIQNSPRVGIVHLAVQNDTVGAILSWQNDVFVVAEPGDLADKFLQSVKFSLLPVMRGLSKKEISKVINISTIAELVSYRPYFQIGCVVHRYIGRQTQVMEDDHEVGAYMFRRTVPSMHLTAEDVRWMVGAWRDRIIIFSGRYGPNKSLMKAFLDSGAKALICPSAEHPEMQLATFHGSGDFGVLENGKFEIGVEEADEDELEAASQLSDWEDYEIEKSGEHPKGFWDFEEEELSRFVCQLYESLFCEGSSVQAALQTAMSSTTRKLRYALHLPDMP